MIPMSKRLKEISELCKDCDILLDIGCDHALIPVGLLKQNEIFFAVASDINEGPIMAAKRNALSAGVSDRIRFVVSDGLSGIDPSDPVLSGKKTVLLISGMGGPLIEKIIKEGEKVLPLVDTFVFSPHSKVAGFRRFLGENGFSITYEKLTKEDGHYYFVIVCKKGPDECRDDLQYELGPGFFDEKSEEKREFLAQKLGTYENLCHNDEIKGEKREELEKMLLLYKKAAEIYDMQQAHRTSE